MTPSILAVLQRPLLKKISEWPSNSPDLNLIENLWAIIKSKVEKRMPNNLDDLENFMIEEWENIPENALINFSSSMRRRCELIIENNGERGPNNDTLILYGGVSFDQTMALVYKFDSQSIIWSIPKITGVNTFRKWGLTGIIISNDAL
ncbi:hypothetical protein RhiirB3_439825 [Rhizophagus irregularis]|nr:hypothetical protein RhiirB3_439825 [Rhizophagus irregularis]